jgi:peptide/nickel transport system substrate-binding protein
MFDGTKLDGEHEMLRVTINGVDPKAQYNFAFTVAPLHYYSTTNYDGVDYVNDFGGKGHFGLKYGDIDFMTNVINAPSKVGLPVGAGIYKASNSTGKGTVTADNFFNSNIIYYERNEYFETLGDGTENANIHNANIKYVRYKVVETDQIINALANGDIDYGDPSATQENIAVLDQKGVKHKEVYTSGYGYVGINPRFIPDVVVRRAIMKAMNTQIITQNYYKGGLAELIWRPMSTTNWAYPKGATVYQAKDGTSYAFDDLGNDIEDMMVAAGYVKNANGIFTKDNLPGFGAVTCDYTFTIAGASQDHPATAMFNQAAKILTAHGFKIKVVTSQTALSDLTTGKLAVWAAAWGSAIDPDMYQVYHKDSKATSVNNWGYKQIKAKFNTEAYKDEFAIVNDLSTLIDEGRETDDQEERKLIYAQALDLIMELAVELPTYQRKDMSAYNDALLNESTMTPDSELSPYNGLLSEMWKLRYN